MSGFLAYFAEILSKKRIIAKPGFNRWLVPPASISIHLCIGSVYAWSIFNPALIKALGVAAPAAGDWDLGQVVWIFSVAIVFLGLAAAFAGHWLERVGLLELANRDAGNLAYGQQRRLEIARCMVTEPRLLMLDEPAAGLNPAETRELNQLIVSLKEDYNVSVVLIEHDMSLVMDISDRINVISQGRPLASGTPEEVRNNDEVIKAYLGEA